MQQNMLYLVIGMIGQQLAAQADALLILPTSQMVLGLPHWIQACQDCHGTCLHIILCGLWHL